MKRIVILLLALCLLTGCAAPAAQPAEPQQESGSLPQDKMGIPTVAPLPRNDPDRASLQAEPQTAANPATDRSLQAEPQTDAAIPQGLTEAPEQDGGDDTEPAVPVCTVSVSCAVLAEHPEVLPPEKVPLVPSDGWLLPPTEAELTEGDSVFDLLLRLCREKGIHLEFSQTPVYDSAYIEGIGNLYEFDGGALSGWMYRVNGEFPHVGCSQVFPQDGDTVEWLYTLDLGGGELP